MDLIDALERSWADSFDLLSAVTPADLGAATPCLGWDVRGVLNHTLGEVRMISDVNRAMPSGNDHGAVIGDGSGLMSFWTSAAQDNVESWRESGLDGDRSYFYGTFPARGALLINLGEVVVHSWDLARATARAYAIEDELAGLVYGLYSSIPLDDARANGAFGPEVAVPADAPIADRMLAVLGRQP